MSDTPETVEVEWNGALWEVATTFVGPVSIGEALKQAEAAGFTLPEPGLVDAIYEAAAVKLLPLPRRHDGTPKTMASPAVYQDQLARIDAQLQEVEAVEGIIDGCFKNVVRLKDGRLGLYGWPVPRDQAAAWSKKTGVPLHEAATPGANHNVIQPLFLGHAAAWEDYSQGCRMVRLKT